MPLQNKVDPFGAIQPVAMRGLFMGNRGGRMHDPAAKALRGGRPWVTRQWISCVTEFRGRKRELMGNSYTELFFLDEVCALAAGHRPCAECRRAEFKRYCAAVRPGGEAMRAPDLDRRLHAERTTAKQTLSESETTMLPDGAMIAVGGTAFARRGGFALPFTFGGYGSKLDWNDVARTNAVLLTPQTSILALINGYQPVWHPSAAT